jgi:hypothetical protein
MGDTAPRSPCDDGPVIIPGYLDDALESPPPLVDATDELVDELFWPTFLWTVGGAATAPHAFPVDLADLEERAAEWQRLDRWPVFSLPVTDGRLHVVLRNFEDDEGIDYVLTADAHPMVEIAALEGHFRGPGLSWAEAVAAAGQEPEDAARRLLLLLPAVGDVATSTPRAHELVTAAVQSVGGGPLSATVAAELLAASDRYWAEQEWTEADGVPVCLSPHSTRHPARASPADLRRIATAFAPPPGRQ